jgi:small-conductance mechanosensitive channel
MRFLIPFLLLGSGIAIGVIVQRVLLGRLKKYALKTPWRGDEILIHALDRWVLFWFILASIYGATLYLPYPLPPPYLNLIRKILLIVGIFSITIVSSKIADGFVNLLQKKIQEIIPSSTFLSNLTKLFIYLLGGLLILTSLGISVTPILAGLGISGLAVALALQDTLSNFFAGVNLILSKKIRPGDYIQLGTGEEGYVTDIQWRYTVLKEHSNNLVIIPNSKIAQAVVRNFHLPDPTFFIPVEVGVSYESDLEKVEKVTLEVARETLKEIYGEKIEFQPLVRFHTFSDSSILLRVVLFGKNYEDQRLIKHTFIKRLHKRYREEGIEIPYPQRTIHMVSHRDPEKNRTPHLEHPNEK